MAITRSVLKNLGKSIAYSSIDVMTKLAPNTTDMLRGARSGVDYTRDVIRTQASKLKIQQNQFDRSSINRQARLFLQDAWNDIKQGNLALGDLSDQSMDDWDNFMDDFGNSGSSSITSFSDSQFNDKDEDSNDQSGRNATGSQAATLISSDRRTLQGLKEVAKVTGSTTIKAAQYQSEQITNALFIQMTAQNDHFIQIERKLDSINANLVQLVKFQSESQAVTNQAMMNFMDQMTRWMKNQDKIQANRSRRTPKAYRSAAENFLMSSRFDMTEYGKVIKENIDSSPLGMLMSMSSMLSPDMIMMALGGGFGGKIQPQKFLLNALMTGLIPKSARRSIARGDSQLGTMAKTMLTRLGARKYSMDRGGLGSSLLGLLGSVFGIDTNLRRTINLGRYKKDDMNWNGEAQKALVQVIPKELAEIKAAITGQRARYFDSNTGTYMDKKQIRKTTRTRLQNAIENPFANIFNNEFSSNPDDRRNKMLWSSMGEDIQKQVEAIVNQAIMNSAGLTADLNKSLDEAINKGIRGAGGTKFDTQRMVMMLADAVNESRSNLASVIEELQSQNSAFMQMASDMADEYGRISFDRLKKEFIGKSAVDLREATGGRYAFNGKRFDQMTPEERRAYEASFNTARQFKDRIKNMKNSRNRFVRGAGRVVDVIDDYRTGARQSRYGKAVTRAADEASYAVYRATMMGENPIQGRRRRASTSASGDVDWDQIDTDHGVSGTENQQDRPRRATTSASTLALPPHIERQGENAANTARASALKKSGGIINRAVANINAKAQSPEEAANIENAENTEQMKDTMEEAFGEKGYMKRIFDSPVMKTIAQKFKNSALGKAIGEKLGSAKKYTGGVLKQGFKDLGNQYLALMKTAFGFTVDDDGEIDQSATPAEGSAAEAIQDSAQQIKDTVEGITGSDGTKDAKKETKDQISKILNSFKQFMKKNAPRGIMGAALGAAVPILAGGKMGLIGGLFMPGGAIGGAILGASLGLLSKTKSFQNFLFGPEYENGERSGGLISKKMVEGFKKALPTLGVGATAGVILKLLSSATGIGGGVAGSVAGAIPSMLLPGGVLGAAIMGSAAAFALKNDKVQNILFGQKDEDGTRKGTILSGAYNKFTSLLKGEATKGGKGDNKKANLFQRILKNLGAAGAGALGATALSQMGLLGSTFTFGGPIGVAIAGAAVGILSSSQKFQEYLYGTKGDDGKRKKDGLLSRFTTMLNLNLVEPVSQYFKTTTEQFAWWAKEKIEVPFRLALGPVIDSFKDLRDSMKDAATGAIKKGGEFIGKKIENILSPIGSFFMKYILKPLGSAAGGLLKTGLFAGASLAGAPFQILSTLLSPVRRKQQKKFGTFLKDNKEQNLQQYWENSGRTGRVEQFFDRLQYNAATLPVVGNLFRNSDVVGDVAEDIYGDPTGQNRNSLNWLNAKRDRKQYRQNRKELRKEDKEWRRMSKIRQQIGKSVGNNADAEFSPIEFAKWQDKLQKMGVDIKDADELRKFTFDYNSWKNPKEDKAEAAQSQMAKDTGEIKGLVEKAVNLLGSIADTSKASVDIQSGTVTDTEDIETGDVSEEIDSDTVEQIQNQKNKATVNAFSGLINKIFKKKQKAANDAIVRGNTSGNAHDEEETAQQIVEEAGVGETENDQSGTTEKSSGGGILSTVLGGIGKVLTSKTGLAALASAAVLAIVGNPEMREMIGNGIGTFLSGAKDWILTKLGLQKDPTGQDTSREADIDGDDETESIVNQDAVRDVANIAVKGKAGIKAVGTVLKHTPVVGTAVKAAQAVGSTAAKVGGKLWNGAKKVATKVGDAASKDGSLVNKCLGWVKSGIEKLANSKFGKALKLDTISKFFDDIVEKVTKNSGKISDLIGKLSTKASSLAGTVGKILSGLNVVMIAGSAIEGAFMPERLFLINKKYVDAKMRIIATIFNALTATAIGAVIDLLSEIVNAVMGVDFIQSLACIVYYAVSDDEDDEKLSKAVEEFKQETANYNEANNTNISVSAYNDLKNKGIIASGVNWVKNLFGKGDKTDYSQYEVGTYQSPSTGNGPGPRRRGRGYGNYYSQSYGGRGLQSDPRWANMPLGVFPNGQLSTMADGGCGPTALSTAANALGLGANPGQVGLFAKRGGYISQGGANDDLFDEGAEKLGLSTKRVSSSADIESSLRRGKPVIMAGKSNRGYGNTPYTSAGHIVTATKMNADGTVTIQDPMRGVGRYNLSDLQGSMTAGWAVDRQTGVSRRKSRGYGRHKSRGYGLFDAIGSLLSTGASAAMTAAASKMGLSSYLTSAEGATDTSANATDSLYAATGSTNINLEGNTQAEQIWNYLISQGYTPEAAAGIMGCWQIESSNRSDRIEGDYLKGFPGFREVLASNQALNNYTQTFLFPAYQRSNISISEKGYKGTDGNYYPGIGLAQWTGPRGYNLFKFAQQNGLDWRNLDTQLAFFNQEIQQRGIKDTFNSATSAADGAHKVLDYYEMYKGYGAKAPTALKKRQDAANSIYSQYKNLRPSSSSTNASFSNSGVIKADKKLNTTATKNKVLGNGPGARGYGLFDAIGNILSTGASAALTSAAGSMGLSGLLNSTTTTGTTVDNNGLVVGSVGAYTPATGSAGQKAVVNKMSSIQGQIKYSLNGNEQDPDKGTASCASTVGWAYRKALGVTDMSASSTTQSQDDRFTTVWTNNGTTPFDKSMLQPGDVLYQNWDRTTNNGKMQHTEMYAGNGQDLSHGGQPEYGPVFKDLDDYRIKHTMMVRRYNGFLTGTDNSGTTTGFGIGPRGYEDPFGASINLSSSGQIGGTDRRPVSARGYGPTAFSNSTAGMESRLDTIIGLMRQIVSMGNKPANNVTNVNYGPGDSKVDVKPTAVVVQGKTTPDIGKHDASNEYLRAQHRRLATARHD